MTKEELNEIKKFLDENKFTARRTDGWGFIECNDAVMVGDIMRKLKNLSRRKQKRMYETQNR